MVAAEGIGVVASRDIGDDECVRVWAESGAMHLTGPATGAPCVSPAGIARPLSALARALAESTAQLGREVRVDGVALTAHRAWFTSAERSGSRSVGGSAHMVRVLAAPDRTETTSELPSRMARVSESGASWSRASDGWVALNLPRASDAEALPALVGTDAGAGWEEIERRLSAMPAEDVVATATLLGLAVAAVGATAAPAQPFLVHNEQSARDKSLRGYKPEPPRCVWHPPPRKSRTAVRQPVVVDLTSLWAGPLAGMLLARAGCEVIKVESVSRPDGARRGPAMFFELLNDTKSCVRLDLPKPEALAALRDLIAGADLVLEASRPRVMRQWGIDPVEVVASGTPWVSITGHGRFGPAGDRIAFGDDAAASGGLVIPGDPPMFVGDAIADPIAGLAAAVASSRLLAAGSAALAEVSLAGAAAWAQNLAGGPIGRPVTSRGSAWIVELKDGAAQVRSPARPQFTAWRR